MSKVLRKIMTSLLATTMVLGLVGCGGNSSPKEEAAQKFNSDVYKLNGYIQDWGNFGTDATWITQYKDIMEGDIDVLMAGGVVMLAEMSRGQGTAKTGSVESIDATTEQYLQSGNLEFAAVKFPSSVGAPYALLMSAINGQAIRNEDGTVPTFENGYWFAHNIDEFNNMKKIDSPEGGYAYSKDLLAKYTSTNSNKLVAKDFAKFAETYKVDEIEALNEEVKGFSYEGIKGSKIMVLRTDDSKGGEAEAMYNYLNYVSDLYGVKLDWRTTLSEEDVYSALSDAKANGYNGVMSMSEKDRDYQLQYCEKEKIYYTILSGSLGEEQYEQYKDYNYFVGSAAPGEDAEYECGYEMAKYFATEKKYTKYGMFGGNLAFGSDDPIFINRITGMLKGLIDSDESGSTNYCGYTDRNEIYDTLAKDMNVKY